MILMRGKECMIDECYYLVLYDVGVLMFQVPIFDGSAREWVDAINQSGLKVAVDIGGQSCQKLAPYLNEPVHVLHNDSFITAIPYPKVRITYGIDYPQVFLMH